MRAWWKLGRLESGPASEFHVVLSQGMVVPCIEIAMLFNIGNSLVAFSFKSIMI